MLAGEEIKGGVYPVRPPQALYEVLPDVNPEPLPDLALALRTGEVFVHLLMERNRLHFARTRLDCNVKEELRLLDRYEQRAIQQVEKSVGVCTKLIQEALSFADVGIAGDSWRKFWDDFAVVVKDLSDLDTIPLEWSPEPILQSSSLDVLLLDYVDQKYLRE
jgi:hypothetical protein